MSEYSAWDVVQTARSLERPTAQYYIKNIFTDFVELHGDRAFGDDGAIIGGIGRLNGIPVTVIGQEKGVSLSEKTKCNFGSAHPEGYRKSLRLMKQAEKFHRPVICIVDTQGAFCGVGAEERGVAEAIARNLMEMSRLKTPVISLLIGEGGSGGAIALAVADKVAMLENSVYSILSPEGFAAILWKDASRAPEAAELMRMPAPEVHAMGLVDDVIPEPTDGAKADDEGAFAQIVKEYLVNTLRALREIPIDELVQARYAKFRAFGQNYVQTQSEPSTTESVPRDESATNNMRSPSEAAKTKIASIVVPNKDAAQTTAAQPTDTKKKADTKEAKQAETLASKADAVENTKDEAPVEDGKHSEAAAKGTREQNEAYEPKPSKRTESSAELKQRENGMETQKASENAPSTGPAASDIDKSATKAAANSQKTGGTSAAKNKEGTAHTAKAPKTSKARTATKKAKKHAAEASKVPQASTDEAKVR